MRLGPMLKRKADTIVALMMIVGMAMRREFQQNGAEEK